MNRVVIGICGGTGSGKTTLAEKIYDEFASCSTLLGMDSYYRCRSTITEIIYERKKQPASKATV